MVGQRELIDQALSWRGVGWFLRDARSLHYPATINLSSLHTRFDITGDARVISHRLSDLCRVTHFRENEMFRLAADNFNTRGFFALCIPTVAKKPGVQEHFLMRTLIDAFVGGLSDLLLPGCQCFSSVLNVTSPHLTSPPLQHIVKQQ